MCAELSEIRGGGCCSEKLCGRSVLPLRAVGLRSPDVSPAPPCASARHGHRGMPGPDRISCRA